MANPVTYDRVLETSITTGTGTLTLAGAVTGYRSFSAVGNGNTCPYTVWAVDTNGNPSGSWETGIGTYTASGTTLARTTVLESSNGNAAVNFGAGTKRVALGHLAQTTPQLGAANTWTVGPQTIDGIVRIKNTSSSATLSVGPGGVSFVTASKLDVQAPITADGEFQWALYGATAADDTTDYTFIFGHYSETDHTGSGDCDYIAAAGFESTVGGGGTCLIQHGLEIYAQGGLTPSGTTTVNNQRCAYIQAGGGGNMHVLNMVGAYFANPVAGTACTFDNNYAIYIANQTQAAVNYGIYVEAGTACFFGGLAQVGTFKMTAGAGATKILTSDASGNGTWEAAPVSTSYSADETTLHLTGTTFSILAGYVAPVANGGTGRASHTAFAVLCGGTTTTGAQQSVASVGTADQVLTSAGAGALPTFQDPTTATMILAGQIFGA